MSILAAFILPMGLAIVFMHPAWVLGPSLIVAPVGWIWTVKEALYLVHPALLQRFAARHVTHPARFQIAGAVTLVLGAVVLAPLI